MQAICKHVDVKVRDAGIGAAENAGEALAVELELAFGVVVRYRLLCELVHEQMRWRHGLLPSSSMQLHCGTGKRLVGEPMRMVRGTISCS